MNATDFIYGGESLSSYGCMIVSFDNTSSMSAINSDSQRSFEQVSMFNGQYQPFTHHTYDDCVKMSFSIIKDPELTDEKEFSQDDIRTLKRWLNSPVVQKLYLLDEDYEDLYWEGVFNVNDLYFNGQAYGLSLEFTSNRPFGLQGDRSYTGTLVANESFTIRDTSDEIGHIYPTLEITCKADGTLDLHNSYDDRHTIIENCVSGEVITFSPRMQITSSVTGHEVYNDFNYRFLRIGNTYDERDNTITTTLPVDYKLTYSPIAKVVAG